MQHRNVKHRPTATPPQKTFSVSDGAVSRARAKTVARDINPFAIPVVPPGIKPTDAKLAMDDAFGGIGTWANGQLQAVGHEGQAFLGYPILAELAQRPENRKIVETISTEMTRRWIKIQATGDEDKTDKITELEAAFDAFKVRDRFREAGEHDGYFGRGHIYLDLGGEGNELITDIGDGSNAATNGKITKGGLKGIRCVEPIWVYPQGYNTTNPLKADWYKPQMWLVNGQRVHASRLLTFVGREVPDILKPAYSFGGLSMVQMAKPYVDNWLRTRQSVSDAVYRFALDIFKTDMADVLNGGGGENFFKRLAVMAGTRDVNSTFAIDKEREDFGTIAKPLGTLDHLQAQAQEQMASIAGIPLVKLLGITPSGLNASSDGEVRCFYDAIHAYQERLFAIPLDRIFAFIQMSTFGEVDPDLTYKFEPLWTLDEKEQAEIDEVRARTDVTYHEAGILLTSEVRKRISGDEDSPYDGLDVDLVPDEPTASEALPEAPGPNDDPVQADQNRRYAPAQDAE